MAAKKRILFITPFGLYRRGTVRYRIVPWAKLLAQVQQAHVRVLVAGWDTPEQTGTISLAEDVELRYLPFRRPFLRWGSVGYIAMWLEMVRYAWYEARTWQPSVVHLSKPLGVPLLFLALYRGRHPSGLTRVVLDCDDLESAWPQGGPFVRWWHVFGTRVERWAWRAADRVTVASRMLFERVQRIRGDHRVHHVCNYTWSASAGPIRMTSRRIVIPTRLLDIRPGILASWMHAIHRQMPDVSLVVVGPEAKQAQRLSEELRAPGLAGITIITRQPPEAYYRILTSARLGLYLVEDSEAARAKCPQRLLDMVTRGLPVIAVDVGEPRYLLGAAPPAGPSALVPPDGAALAKQVAMVWRNRLYLEMLQRQSESAWRELLQPERIAETLWDAYFS